MPSPLVECIPNFSEARRPEVVAEILNTIQQVEGITVLDHSSDLDHNRTVITFVGEPASVELAAFNCIAKAAELIDMTQHTGGHPRIGAADVVPLVPIRGISVSECVQIARRLGQRVAENLHIPVYLYEEAASRPERKNLEEIRRGQYEGLKSEIAIDPQRKPDFGPSELGTPGATVIGVRQPLIAFNVYLTTGDVEIAQKIARSVRHSSGGYAFVKAMGILVNGRAQISMNLTDYHKTPIYRVVETIRREAQRYGVAIHHSELVGLIPQEALIDSAVWYVQLDDFTPEQILEHKLESIPASEKDKFPQDFIDQLAAGTPTPGGGAAAAHTGAEAAALVAMVARLTLGKKKYAEVESTMLEVLEQAETLRKELSAAEQLDAQAFEKYMAANKLPRSTPEEQTLREPALEKATFQAALIPLSVAQKAAQVMQLALQVVKFGNLNAISDGGSAAALAHAASVCAGYNVRINLLNLKDKSPAQEMLSQLSGIEQLIGETERQIMAVLSDRGKIHP